MGYKTDYDVNHHMEPPRIVGTPDRPPQSEVEAVINVLMSQIASLRVALDTLDGRLRPVMLLHPEVASEPDAIGHQKSSENLCLIARMVETQTYMVNAAIEQVRRITEDLRI